MSDQALLARKIKVETNIRCDFDNLTIQKGKFATQVVGDPEVIKCQGIYHGSQCYNGALASYKEKVKEHGMKEDINE